MLIPKKNRLSKSCEKVQKNSILLTGKLIFDDVSKKGTKNDEETT